MSSFHESFDATVWATAWLEIIAAHPTIPTDEGTMIGWFANALMRGYDEHARRYPVSARSVVETRPEADDALHVPTAIEALADAAETYDNRGMPRFAASCRTLRARLVGSLGVESPGAEIPKAESAAAALFGFMGWLTSQPVAVGPFSDVHNATLAADLVAQFCKSQDYAEPPHDFHHGLKPYPQVPSASSSVPNATEEATDEG